MLRYYFTILFFLIIFQNCVSVPPGAGGTYFYNHFSTTQMLFPVPQGELTGHSDGACYLSMICLGDTRVSTAAKSAGIDTVTSVEYEFFSFMFLYSKTTIIVHGNKK